MAELKKKQADIQKSLMRRDMKQASFLKNETKNADTAEEVNE
jgi:hypothetical protein